MKVRKKSRSQLLHQYYKYTGFYSFIWQGVKSAILPTAVIVGILFYVNYKVINLNEGLQQLTQNLNDFAIFGVFLASETILGIIPPDIFIAWTKSTSSPLLYLAILAILSYIGGVLAYFIGMTIAAIPAVNNFLYGKMARHIINMQKWGGFLIAVGALLPLPFAMACLAAGMIKFSRKHFFLFALLRFFRFIIYGFLIYSALS
ncbi:short-chain dehydrogenase [Flavobacterium tibetense]|jgi:membrane protein YqaA with SNARE-associated domain|uniref:Short-chain dehydrogenase n=1 Tax=Flavobacterium tibetense TaxID=2233533 RepID=A0A365P1X9_9FLAO|nr:short-chain dehydrogenase [Flavobacterium tibetense]RBA28538.1 short-chain dehydrogenase [Flavobacterium tibetense]